MAAMLISYLKTAVRGLLRRRLYAAINIAGLAVGLACALLISLYVRHELSYEAFNELRERVFRVVRQGDLVLPAPLAASIAETFAEVESTARLTGAWRPLIRRAETLAVQQAAMADPALLGMLDIPFVRGGAIERPYTAVLSVETARYYFGDDDPLGQTLRWDTSFDVEVTGVFTLPTNTHFAVPVLVSYSTMAVEPTFGPLGPDAWFGANTGSYVYVQMHEAPPPRFGERLLEAVGKHSDWLRNEWESTDDGTPRLQRVSDIHLHSHTPSELKPGGRRDSVILAAAIGVFVLFIACVNFVSLSTARSTQRVGEAGIRLAIGARRGQLAGLFLLESAVQVVLAAGLAVGLTILLAPRFEALAGRPLTVDAQHIPWLAIGLTVVACLGAAYPAAVLARFEAARVFQDAAAKGSTGSVLRRRLVEFQLALSMLLVLATAAVSAQFEFLRSADVGFERERTLLFRVGYPGVRERSEALAEGMARLPSVAGVTRFHRLPFEQLDSGSRAPVKIGGLSADIWSDPDAIRMPILSIDHAFVPVMGLEILAGRNVAFALPEQQLEVLVNESAAAAFGFDDPSQALGMPADLNWRGQGTVVGVVRDFHYEPLRHAISPLVLRSPRYVPLTRGDSVRAHYYSHVAVRLRPGRVEGGIGEATAVWREMAPAYPFDYWFLDDAFDRQYHDEARLSQLLEGFAGVAVAVAALGVFSLAAFTVQLRTKEIGVRKVLGASTFGVVALLSREYGRLLLVGAAIAWPLAHWSMGEWLAGFAYRVEPGWVLYLGATGLVLLTTAVAVAHQVTRAARASPVEALRYE